MAHCDEFIELISAAIDGALSPHEQKRLEDHLAQCPECTALYEDLSALHATLSQLPPVEVPAGLSERIMEAVAAEKVIPLAPAEKKKSPIRWQRFLATAAVLAVVWMGTWAWKPWEMKVSPSAALNTGLQQSGSATITADVLQDAPEAAELSPEEEPGAASSLETAAGGALAPEPYSANVKTTAGDGGKPKNEQNSISADDSYESTEGEAASIAPRMAQIAGEDEGDILALPTEAPEEAGTAVLDETNGLAARSFMIAPAATNAPAAEMSGREALDVLLEAYPMPENASLVDTGERLGWETPLSPVDGGSAPNAQQVSTRLEYIGVSPNGKYHEFWLSSFLLDDPTQGLAHSSTINYFAVPLDGGEILVQRSVEADQAHGGPEAYQEEIEAYNQALSQ